MFACYVGRLDLPPWKGTWPSPVLWSKGGGAKPAGSAPGGGRLAKDRAVQPLLCVAKGDQVPDTLALIFGRFACYVYEEGRNATQRRTRAQ